ncbi:MAG TPA: hypothetical protein VFV99_16170 [Kofleriaceae bacterium]|nr:hypothetical protein [Kofleriaceae bacterium]
MIEEKKSVTQLARYRESEEVFRVLDRVLISAICVAITVERDACAHSNVTSRNNGCSSK